jgi:hypothetical protein
MRAGCHLFRSASDNLPETTGIQGSASHQGAVNVILAHQCLRVFRLNTAPVLDSNGICGGWAKSRSDHGSDERVYFLGLGGRRSLPVPMAHTGS